jgi:hypothetical protein
MLREEVSGEGSQAVRTGFGPNGQKVPKIPCVANSFIYIPQRSSCAGSFSKVGPCGTRFFFTRIFGLMHLEGSLPIDNGSVLHGLLKGASDQQSGRIPSH